MVLGLRAASVVAFLLLWEWAARVPVSFNFPSPWATVAALVALLSSGALPAATLISLQSLLLGFGAAVLVGVPLGLLMGVIGPVGRVARVYLDLLIALPTAALVPLVILSVGINIVSSAVIVFVFSAPFVVMNAYGGVRDVRPRLVERLNQGLHRKLTLISAPAGFGKTTLVSAWVAGCDRRVAWLSLDEGDSDPVRFLIYLVAALRTVRPTIGEAELGELQSSQPPPAESVLTASSELTATAETLSREVENFFRNLRADPHQGVRKAG